MKASEIRDMGEETLEQELDAKRKQLLDLRCQIALGEDVRPHQMKELKRDIARINTVTNERKAAAIGDN